MADLSITPRDGLGIVSVLARRGVHTIDPATDTLIGVGPGSWLLLRENAEPGFAEEVAERLRGVAAVSDQSSAYRVLRLAGADARTLLQRAVAIDLHPDSFGAGSSAVTVAAHIGVIIRQVDDAPSYDVATFRSYATSFDAWLATATAAL